MRPPYERLTTTTVDMGMGSGLKYQLCLLAGAALGIFAISGQVHAQAATADADTPPAVPVAYVPADFARFAPRNALDMLEQIPSFSIRNGDDQRGLGQADTNVLINGARVSSKSDGVFDQLRRISIDRVDRIEMVDGATLGIPGLSGQVANVLTRPGAISGRYQYRATARPKYADPSYFGGEVSVSGSGDSYEWTLAYNHGVGRGAAAGGTAHFADPDGVITENTDARIKFNGEFPQLSARGKWTSPGGTIVNLNGNYGRQYTDFSNDELRTPVDGSPAFFRDFDNRRRGWSYEIGGDVDFALGPGRLKLIGLDRFNHNNFRQTSITTVEDDNPDTGNRFASIAKSGERIGRSEYRWAMLGGDWQLDAEAAFNRLNQSASLFNLDPTGDFVEIPFPNSSGGVTEDRYESILTHSRTLVEGLSMQLGAGAEYSTLAQTGPDGLTRRFWRPKGSLTLGWAVEDGLDISLELAREVGQLSFGDFLASVALDQNNSNAGNNRLVPPQSWDLELEAQKSLGPWGSTTLRLSGSWIEDQLEFIPVGDGLETRGNIPSARLFVVDWRSTFELAPLGWNGGKLDTRFVYRDTSLTDPLTGEKRPFSAQQNVAIELNLRHDIPGSDWAWGVGMQYNHTLPFIRLGEVGRDDEGPIYTFAFVEHKDVLGMTANVQVFNATDGRARYKRTVYDGYRDRTPVLFREYRNLSVQPIFRIQLTGDF